MRQQVSALLAGLAYIAIGRFFPNPAADARWWRLGAWMLSAVVFGAHLVYEYRQGRTALHGSRSVSIGAAIGGFGLAAWAATLAAMRTGSVDGKWLIALGLWPVLLALPAFVAGYVVLALLQRINPHHA